MVPEGSVNHSLVSREPVDRHVPARRLVERFGGTVAHLEFFPFPRSQAKTTRGWWRGRRGEIRPSLWRTSVPGGRIGTEAFKRVAKHRGTSLETQLGIPKTADTVGDVAERPKYRPPQNPGG